MLNILALKNRFKPQSHFVPSHLKLPRFRSKITKAASKSRRESSATAYSTHGSSSSSSSSSETYVKDGRLHVPLTCSVQEPVDVDRTRQDTASIALLLGRVPFLRLHESSFVLQSLLTKHKQRNLTENNGVEVHVRRCCICGFMSSSSRVRERMAVCSYIFIFVKYKTTATTAAAELIYFPVHVTAVFKT